VPLILSFVIGLFITIVMIPPLMRLSHRFGLVDVPDERKIHVQDIPRVGGIAIAVAIVLAIFTWFPVDRLIAGCLVGGAVILMAGIWDDRRSLPYQWKLAAQCVAVAFAMACGVTFEHLPFLGLEPAPVWLTYPVTFIFLVGVTNAINLFDGLDGLAGGCMLMTLGAIAFLDFQSGGSIVVFVALAAMGGIIGFLRYNTHPAIVFMGDSGSQLLGFVAAVLAIILVERTHGALNPALPLLLLGLPIYDTLTVMVLRISNGQSPFRPDQTHLHHKLLRFGFRHYEAVAIIYVVQAMMVGSALLVGYASDLAVVATFLAISGGLTVLIYLARVRNWSPRPVDSDAESPRPERRNLWLRRWERLPSHVTMAIAVGLSGFLIVAASIAAAPTHETSWICFAVAGVLIAGLLDVSDYRGSFARLGPYFAGVVLVFHLSGDPGYPEHVGILANAYVIALLGFLVVGVRVTRRALFRVTPQDLLIAFFALALPNLPIQALGNFDIGPAVFRALVLFYAIEFVLSRPDGRPRLLLVSSIASLALFAGRGLV